MPDVSRATLQHHPTESWFRSALRGALKKWIGTSNAEVRDAWIERALGELSPGSRLLDAGAGELQYKRFCGHLQYVSQDFGQYDGTGDRSGLQMGSWDSSQIDIISDITSIPEPDASFDVIMCVEVLEHVPAPIEALREFSRLLRPGGVLLLTAPFASLTHFSPYHFYSGFNRYFYSKWLYEFGFKIVELTPNGNFFEFVSQELNRARTVARDCGRRRLNLIQELAVVIVLRALRKLSQSDAGSHSLLCFGYFVKAVKQ